MIGKCPKCGDAVVVGETKYFCRSNDCDFQFGIKILEQPINQVQAAKLLSDRRTDVLDRFISKSGKPFPAYLVMDHVGKITFEFPSQESDADSGNDSENSAKVTECKALLNAATKSIFRSNAFRITGLPVDATGREIAKHVDKLKIMAELGQAHPGNHSAFALKPSPTSDHIREAIQKLKEPELRIIDEFFWFWPVKFGGGATDPAIQALANNDSNTAYKIWNQSEHNATDGLVAKHNLAIMWHIRALDEEIRIINANGVESPDVEQLWRQAFTYWKQLEASDGLVIKVSERVRQIDDARLTTDFAVGMIMSLPDALDKINAELALVHAERGNIGMARLHIQFMQFNIRGDDNVEKMADLVLVSHKSRLQEYIRQAKKIGDDNPGAADAAATNLLRQAKPVLELFALFYSESNHTRADLSDEVANATTDCAVDYQKKTGDDQMFLSLLEQALPYAGSSETRQRINKNIGIAKNNIASKELRPAFENLRRIMEDGSSPMTKLARINDEVIFEPDYYYKAAQLSTAAVKRCSTPV